MEKEDHLSFAAIRVYLGALEKAAAQVTRWKEAAPSRYAEVMSQVTRLQEGLAGGLNSEAFKSELHRAYDINV